MDCIVYGVAKSLTQVTNLHFHFQRLKVLFLYLMTSLKMYCSFAKMLQKPTL